MPFYKLPSGETTYIYDGTEYTGYGGPGDLVGVSGEYAPNAHFDFTPGGIDSSPLALTPEQRAGMVQRQVNIRGQTPIRPSAALAATGPDVGAFGQQILQALPSTPSIWDVGQGIQQAYKAPNADLTNYQSIYKSILKQLGVG